MYQNLQKAKRAVETSWDTSRHAINLMIFNSIQQILENMKTAYSKYVQRTGRVLPEGWDTVGLQKPEPSKGAKALATPSTVKGTSTPADIDDPDYNPEPICHLDPTVMGASEPV